LGYGGYSWQDTEYVLLQFGRTAGSARKSYREFVEEQLQLGRQPELTGGGLVRSAGGWSEVLSMRKRGERQFSDERILGSGAFVEEVLGEVGEAQKEMMPVRMRQEDAHRLIERECKENGLSIKALQGGSRNKGYSTLRRVLAGNLVDDLGLSHADVARMLGISRAGVSQMMRRR
jgi:hypothetical protein